MEIDLELPSNEEEKLDTGSPTNVDIEDSVDGMNEEEDGICPTIRHVTDVNGPNVSEAVTGAGALGDLITVGEDVVKKGAICEPQNGMEFESKEAAYSFYREYARSVGFGITIKASRRSKKTGKFIDVKIACSRFGSKRESGATANPRSCPKTDCKASLHMKRRQDEKWFICSFAKEHNHDICPEDFYYTIKGGNKQSTIVACQKRGLQLALDEGDVQVMLEYFMYMQAENPNFFYAIDLDHEKRLRGVFWLEAKGRHDYSKFCDVVFVDTFYVRNKYKIPFVPIFGVNNHLQLMLLGCALLGEETTSSFVWLMRTWLKAVGAKAPRVIITDQEKFLKEAVVDIFPETHHCFSLWHVLSKLPQRLDYVINQNENFMTKFNKCIYQSWTEEQFERRWWKMIDEFRLREDEWLQSLYEDHKKWVPTYMRDIFLAGMSTTERSGSIVSFFDKYVHEESSFKEWLEQYKAFLNDSYELETKAELEMRHRQPASRSLLPLEKQMSTLYTNAVFKKFHVEVLGAASCNVEKESEDGPAVIFQVNDFEDRQDFTVAWNEEELDICCQCRSFEYKGFLCRHAILVLQRSGVSLIPSNYVLKRWTIDAKMSCVSETSNGLHYRVLRFNDLCKRAIKLGEGGSLSQETYNIAIQASEEVLKHCVSINNSVRSVLEPNTLTIHGFPNMDEENHMSSTTKSSKKKKTDKKRKLCSETEVLNSGTQDKCQQMERMNSRSHALDNCYIPQQDIQGMDLGSRVPNLDGYYGSHQQSMQGVGQLNSISPIRDNFYSNQQGMQGLGQLHSIATSVGHYGTQHHSMQGLLHGHLSYRGRSNMHGCFEIHDSLEDMEQSASSSQFHGIPSKHLHDKHHSR